MIYYDNRPILESLKIELPRQAAMQQRCVNESWSMNFVVDKLADGTKFGC